MTKEFAGSREDYITNRTEALTAVLDALDRQEPGQFDYLLSLLRCPQLAVHREIRDALDVSSIAHELVQAPTLLARYMAGIEYDEKFQRPLDPNAIGNDLMLYLLERMAAHAKNVPENTPFGDDEFSYVSRRTNTIITLLSHELPDARISDIAQMIDPSLGKFNGYSTTPKHYMDDCRDVLREAAIKLALVEFQRKVQYPRTCEDLANALANKHMRVVKDNVCYTDFARH